MLIILGSVLLTLLPGAARANGTAQVWMTDYSSSPKSVAHADIDGGNATSFAASGAWATAFDIVNERVIWFDSDLRKLYSSGIDGSNKSAGLLISPVDPYGISFDQTTGRVYYGQRASGPENTVFWATLDGGPADQIAYQGTHARRPFLASIDPSSGRVYWLNDLPNNGIYTIGWASTAPGSTAAGEIARSTSATCGAATDRPFAYMVLPQRNEIIWFLNTTKNFERTDMDGSNCRLLTNSGAAGSTFAMAFDPATSRVYYFGNSDGNLHYFDADAPSTAGTVPLSGPYAAIKNRPNFPVIVAPPTASVSMTQAGSALECDASFYAGIPSAWLYSAPTSATTYAWLKDGVEIAGATGSSYSPTAAGEYRCVARASNMRGEGSSISEPITVTVVPTPARESTPASGGTQTAPVTKAQPAKPKVTNISSSAATVAMTVKVPGKGRIVVRGTYGTATAFTLTQPFAKAASSRVMATLNARTRAVLQRRSLREKVTTTFIAGTGERSTTVRYATLTRFLPRPEPVTG